MFNNKQGKYLIFFLFKTFTLIVGLNIFLSSLYKILKEEFNKNNLESEINLNSKKLIYNIDFENDKDIY